MKEATEMAMARIGSLLLQQNLMRAVSDQVSQGLDIDNQREARSPPRKLTGDVIITVITAFMNIAIIVCCS